jgi:SdrD B-like domain
VTQRYEPAGLELVSPIQLVATIGAGTPDGPLSFTATVSTDSPESSTDNNSLQATTTYRAQGFISGRVWLDQNRNGQRDPGEPAVESGGDGIWSLQFLLEHLTNPAWDTPAATVNGDGTYTARLGPGRYYVRAKVGTALDFTTPNVGDEATDSDVTVTARTWDGVTAESAVVDVVDGRHTAVDIGLVTAQP